MALSSRDIIGLGYTVESTLRMGEQLFLDDDPAIAEVFTRALKDLEKILVAAVDTAPTVC